MIVIAAGFIPLSPLFIASKNGYVEKQPVAQKNYCSEYWLKELQGRMGICTGRCDMTIEIQLKTALNTTQYNQSINQSINQSYLLIISCPFFKARTYRVSKKSWTILKTHSLLQMLKLSTIFSNTGLYPPQKAVLNIPFGCCDTQFWLHVSEREKNIFFGWCMSFYIPCIHVFNPFPNKPWFLRVCSTSLLKSQREKEKLLVMSNFSFSHSVFYPFEEHSFIFIKFKIVVCKLFQFGRV